MKTKNYALTLLLLCNSLFILAQNSTMIIHKKDGNIVQIPTNIIDSVTHSLQLPIVTTNNIQNITTNSAICGGKIIGYFITQHGIVWSTNPNPTLSNKLGSTNHETGSGSFTSNLTGLIGGVTYYVRAYATNSAGTAYGNQVSFTTSPVQLASLSTTTISAITINTAVSGGNVTNNGGGTITSRGVCWSTRPNPTTSNNKTTNGSDTGSFTSNLIGLTGGRTYYVRAYAINSAGTSYGNEVSFTTSPVQLATLSTTTISSITSTTAVSGGNVTNNGGGTITSRGVCWSTSANPTTSNNKTTNGSGLGSFTSNLTDLRPGETYYVRAYAINSAGTSYGNQVTFTTPKFEIGDYTGRGVVFYDKGNYNDGWRYLEYSPTYIIRSSRDDAVDYCDNSTYGGKGDWFLPSIDHLVLIYKNIILTKLSSDSHSYWSSTHSGNDYKYFDFSNGRTGSVHIFNNSITLSARPVRKF